MTKVGRERVETVYHFLAGGLVTKVTRCFFFLCLTVFFFFSGFFMFLYFFRERSVQYLTKSVFLIIKLMFFLICFHAYSAYIFGRRSVQRFSRQHQRVHYYFVSAVETPQNDTLKQSRRMKRYKLRLLDLLDHQSIQAKQPTWTPKAPSKSLQNMPMFGDTSREPLLSTKKPT